MDAEDDVLVHGCRWIEVKLRYHGETDRHDCHDHSDTIAEAGGRVFPVPVGARADELAAV